MNTQPNRRRAFFGVHRRSSAAEYLLLLLCALAPLRSSIASDASPAKPEIPKESDYSTIVDITAPEDVVLETGGLIVLADGRSLLCTRRGYIYLIEGLDAAPPLAPIFKLWAQGLQEPLGLLERDGWIYCAQRGELTRMKDTNGDDKADRFETVCDKWEISGNYHEYAFGPALDRDGNFWVTLNKPFGGEPFGVAKWRGWAVKIKPDGTMIGAAAGLRSPAGIAASPAGDLFYTDNQGEWNAGNKLCFLEEGAFYGHPHGIESCKLPESIVAYPGEPKSGRLYIETMKEMPSLRLPAVWFPYDKMGKSASGMIWDVTGGKFGPFEGQLFVGDQHHSSLMRVDLEKVRGRWQGACFPFREGFKSGVLRMAWNPGSTMLVGLTNRGWGSRGSATDGLQRLDWNGKIPFEIKTMRARGDGFELTLTQPADPASVGDLAGYKMESYTYLLHSNYGSDEVEKAQVTLTGVELDESRTVIRLRCEGLREGHVHELHAKGLRNEEGHPLLHPEAYYTLNLIP